jgi:hypothetical protein
VGVEEAVERERHEPEAHGAGPDVWAPLRDPDYLRLFIGQLVSVVGDKLQQIAMAMLVYQRTGSMVQMGIMLGVTALPAVLFALPAGVVVDWIDRRWMMIVMDLLRAFLVLLVPLLAGDSLWAAYAIAFLVSTAALFFDPARLALVPEVVPAEHLLPANSLDQMGMSVSELFGLALGGAVVATVGVMGAFAIDAGTFVISALTVFLVVYRAPITPGRPTDAGQMWSRMVEDIGEGVRFTWSSRVLREMTEVYALTALAGMGLITLSHLLALFTLKGGSMGLAVTDAAITIGMLAGAYLVARFPGRSGVAFLVGVAAFGAFAIALGFVTTMTLALPLLLLAGVANVWFVVSSLTVAQRNAHSGIRGRVFAARAAITRTAGVVGLVGAGVLAQRIGVGPTFVWTGAGLLVVAALGGASKAIRTA